MDGSGGPAASGPGHGRDRDTGQEHPGGHGPDSAGEPELVRDQAYWDERYCSAAALWSDDPNPQLVTEAAALPPGRALDAGCGEGADALWLARRGWRVTAADLSTVALERGADRARRSGTDAAAAERITWLHVDLTSWAPEAAAFDLVSAQFLQLPQSVREPLYQRLAAAVAPGGTLLIVGHDPSDLATGVHRPHHPGLFFTAEQAAACLEPGQWQIVAAEARPRPAPDPDGRVVTVHDAVLRATRLAAAG